VILVGAVAASAGVTAVRTVEDRIVSREIRPRAAVALGGLSNQPRRDPFVVLVVGRNVVERTFIAL
jgi:hypothetical protein